MKIILRDAAIARYKKVGSEIEGTHKKYAFRNGQFADVRTMATGDVVTGV